MGVLISMQVGPVDWAQFREAIDWVNSLNAPGFISRKVYRAEDDPSTALVLEEWESHDAFHRLSDQYGDEFNRRAGTDGAEWQDRSWAAA